MLYLSPKIKKLSNHNTTPFNIVAKTQQGLEPILADELAKLGATNIELHKRAVSFYGDNLVLYKANLHARTALRILVPIKKFSAINEQQLYDEVKKIKWDEFMDANDTLSVEASSNSDFFNHTKYIALKTKDAIVDQFRENYGVRPNVDLEQPILKLNLHIFQNECTLSLDSSGESLHRRGYRADANLAPLNEVTAAALIIHSGWNGEGNFVDGMCGSGTILIEAAMYAKNIPANMNRKWFGFMGWKNFDSKLWDEIKLEALNNIRPSKAHFIGNDAVFKVIEIARGNVIKAGLENDIKLSNMRFEEQKAPEGGGIIIMNPPYGERIEMEDVNGFYRMIGDTLKKNFTGYDAWIISSNKEALKHMHLTASKKLVVWNGQLECKFHKYQMYRGTLRIKKNKGS